MAVMERRVGGCEVSGLRRRAAGEGGFFVEISERALEPGREVGLGLPAQQALDFTDVRAAPGQVVDRQLFPLDQSDWR
jgi:hypothetical protein